LGLDSNKENAESLAKGLKELRMGDILELFLDEKLERKILNEDYVKNNKD
jgi:2-isopropylmalate synthase